MRFVIVIGMLFLSLAALAQTPRTVPSSSFLGVGVEEIDADRAKTLKLSEEAGVEVTRVERDSPAERAGLKTGDAVIQYNGQRVEGMEQFSRLVRETPPGREVKVDIVRNGVPQTVTVRVGLRQAPQIQGGFPMPPPGLVPDVPRSFLSWRSAMLGIEAEPLGGQLGEYFGVKEGVLVRSVIKGSAAEKAGVKAGDVITRIDDRKIATPADISSRLRSLRGKSVPLMLMRDHREMTLTVTLDDADRAEKDWERDFMPAVWPYEIVLSRVPVM